MFWYEMIQKLKFGERNRENLQKKLKQADFHFLCTVVQTCLCMQKLAPEYVATFPLKGQGHEI